jgi:hypothetical protein
MKKYLAIITFENPYPKVTEKVVGGSSIAVATGSAIREWRTGDGKGKRVDKLTIKITKL